MLSLNIFIHHVFFLMIQTPPQSTLFPYTTLFRSFTLRFPMAEEVFQPLPTVPDHPALEEEEDLDRKSTRLNSSHLGISYAVFCLKKKKKHVHCVHPCSIIL